MKKKLNNLEAASFLGLHPTTLETWRCLKKGPKYSKIGRRVIYDIQDLEDYCNSKTVHTLDTNPKLVMFKK